MLTADEQGESLFLFLRRDFVLASRFKDPYFVSLITLTTLDIEGRDTLSNRARSI